LNSLSLKELNSTIKKTLSAKLSPSYWVIAEISEMRLNPTGHCYLELIEKEDSRIAAKSKATIWANTYSNLSLWFEKMTGDTLHSGMKILFNATVQYHEVYGLSLNIKDIDASFTIGEKAANKQKALNQLAEEGVLTMNRELNLAPVLQCIAIISSPTAAGYGDFMDQISNNPLEYSFKSRLFEATMQGNTSPQSIIKALHEIHESGIDYDLVVIIRGGGSQSDLDSYDTYDIGAHIAQFPIPIATGIGHERDESIADIVAHVALKTPTAVAEFIIDHNGDYENEIKSNFQHISTLAKSLISNHSDELQSLKSDLLLATRSLSLSKKHRFQSLSNGLINATSRYLDQHSHRLEKLSYSVEILSPDHVLKRGYTMTTINGKLVDQLKHVKVGDEMVTNSLNYTLNSKIIKKNKK